jgi:hypothetical protein
MQQEMMSYSCKFISVTALKSSGYPLCVVLILVFIRLFGLAQTQRSHRLDQVRRANVWIGLRSINGVGNE